MATKISRYKRKAAGKVLLASFSLLSHTANVTLVFNHLDWDLLEGEGIFTPKEKVYMEKLRKRIHDDGELCRQLGQRLCR